MASKKDKAKAEETAPTEPSVDVLAAQVDDMLRGAGADSGGMARSEVRGPTMEALLRQYTQCF